nr:hypothetical protein [Tanacetum cinerariifolium]
MHKAFPLPAFNAHQVTRAVVWPRISTIASSDKEDWIKMRARWSAPCQVAYAELGEVVVPVVMVGDGAVMSGRMVTVTAEDMKKKKNDVKARTTLLLSLPDEHQLRFNSYVVLASPSSTMTTDTTSGESGKKPGRTVILTAEDMQKKKNNATKKTKKNLLKQQYGNFKAEVSETLKQTFNRLTNVPTASASVATISQDTACAYIASQSSDALTIIENKSKVRNSRSKPIASPVKACDINSNSEIAKLTHAVNQQTNAVTTAMTAMLKQLQANPPPAQVKAVEEICVTCEGAHPYYQCLSADGNTFPEFRDNIQGYVSAAAGNYNQGNPGYRPQGVANQMRPPGFNFHLNELEKIKRMNDVSMKAMQNQIDMVKNKLRNEMKTSIQTSLSNQTNEIKNMMASLLQMNTASTSGSGSLLGNTVSSPKDKLKAITTHSGLVTDGPTVPTPPKSVTPEEDECVEETYTDPDLAEYIIKVPPHPVKKHKPSF